MDDIRVRPATLEDLPHILRHRQAMFADMGCAEGDAMNRMAAAAETLLREALADGSYRHWLALSGPRVVAGGGIHIIPWVPGYRDPTSRRPYIHGVYTEPEFRRRGAARAVMAAIVEWCRDAGFLSVSLHSTDAGRLLYISMGFQSTNEMRLDL